MSELTPAEAGDLGGEFQGLGAVQEAVAVDGFREMDGAGEEEAEALVVGVVGDGGAEVGVWKAAGEEGGDVEVEEGFLGGARGGGRGRG